jgi:hypothetical protein
MARAEAGEPDKPDMVELDGLNYPDEYLFPRWQDYRKHGVYPDGRGRDDQPQALLDDFANLDRRYNYHLYKVSRK